MSKYLHCLIHQCQVPDLFRYEYWSLQIFESLCVSDMLCFSFIVSYSSQLLEIFTRKKNKSRKYFVQKLQVERIFKLMHPSPFRNYTLMFNFYFRIF